MVSASYEPSPDYEPSSDPRRPSFRRRATGFLLALAVEALIAIALLLMETSRPPPPKAEPRPVAFQLVPEPEIAPKPSPRPRAATKVKHASGGASPKTPKPVAPPPPAPEAPPALLVLSKDEFAASDISKLPASGNGDTGEGTGSGKDSGSVYGPGEGPGGQRLYNAEWYREPTHAEMATYMPPGAQTGWGEIACKTIEHYHVENCRQLGESPMGSGLSRAMRLASWQFLVRPPRIGGHAMIGAWVRIRFDLTVGVEKK
jgi:hypothetical protein